MSRSHRLDALSHELTEVPCEDLTLREPGTVGGLQRRRGFASQFSEKLCEALGALQGCSDRSACSSVDPRVLQPDSDALEHRRRIWFVDLRGLGNR